MKSNPGQESKSPQAMPAMGMILATAISLISATAFAGNGYLRAAGILNGEKDDAVMHAPARSGLIRASGTAPSDVNNKADVPLYPGAKLDSSATGFLQNSGMDGAAYSTSASLNAVTAFYSKQPMLKRRGDLATEYVLFGAGCREEYIPMMKKSVSLGCSVDITLQSPWMDPHTGQMINGTLISIVDNSER